MYDLSERNYTVSLWMLLTGVLTLLTGIVLRFVELPGIREKAAQYAFILTALLMIPSGLFYLQKPEPGRSHSEELVNSIVYFMNLSRNAFLFTIILSIVSFIIYNSTANSVARFFVLLCGLSYLLACVTHFISLQRYKK